MISCEPRLWCLKIAYLGSFLLMAVLGAQAAEEPDLTDAGGGARKTKAKYNRGPSAQQPYTLSGQCTNHLMHRPNRLRQWSIQPPPPSLSDCHRGKEPGREEVSADKNCMHCRIFIYLKRLKSSVCCVRQTIVGNFFRSVMFQ